MYSSRAEPTSAAAITQGSAGARAPEKAWAAPHSLNPDRLEQSKKSARFETVGDQHVLTDGKRSIAITLSAPRMKALGARNQSESVCNDRSPWEDSRFGEVMLTGVLAGLSVGELIALPGFCE